MPRTNIAATQATRSGAVLPAATAGDVTNGNSTPNDGRVVLIIKNTGASSRTVTFATNVSVDGLTAPVRSESIPAGETQVFGPFSPNDYGTVLAYNVDNAELTVQALRV